MCEFNFYLEKKDKLDGGVDFYTETMLLGC